MNARVIGTFSQPRTRATPGAGRLKRLPGPAATPPGEHRVYMTESGCTVIVEHEPVDLEPAKASPAGAPESEQFLLWHLLIAHADRYPTWDEIADVRYALIPDDVTMMMHLPPAGEYVNAHNHCLHLFGRSTTGGRHDGGG